MIIDSHSHFHHLSAENGSGEGRKIVENALRHGIGACVVSCLYAASGAMDAYPSSAAVRQANSYAADQARRNSGRLYFLTYLNPQNPDWAEELARGVKNGAVGIKLWLALKNPRGGLEETAAVLRRAAELQLPVLLHVFNRTGGNLPGEIDMMEFAQLSRAVPECVMIAGHAGGNWRESSGLLDYCSPNTFWETGGSNPERGMVDGILKFCPPDRLLYGSDAPGRAFAPQIWKITESSLSETEREKVLFRNALRIFRLSEPAPCETVPPPEETIFPPPGADEDHYCFCGQYPFDRRPAVPPEKLEAMLEKENITAAFTAELDSIFHLDLPESNREFLTRCASLRRVRPLAVVNPAAHNWIAALDQAIQAKSFAGVWISPVFHSWKLDEPRYLPFFRRCAEAEIPLWINLGFGEPRFFHASLRLRPAAETEIAAFMTAAPPNAYVFQGKIPPENLPPRADCRWVLCHLTDFAGQLKKFIQTPHPPQLVWGSEFPFRALGEVRAAAVAQLRQ